MIGQRLKRLRKEHHLTQEKLAEELHVSRNTISKWESDICDPDIENLKLLCQYFHCDIECFIQTDRADNQQDSDLDIKTAHLSSADQWKKHWMELLLLAEIVFILCLYILSQCISSQKEISQHLLEKPVFSAESDAGSYIDATTYIEVKEFIPFLKTYGLDIVFAVVVLDALINVVLIIKRRYGKSQRKM
ncbi:MAG: helix-turn-helix domain-containing protein [Lachnospiraceae bacterium]|nr:helix-turn-helix domain-containing protein [Lachnospiraceae bacterium]